MVQFIKVGTDRIKLDTIGRYGIKSGVRYLVKDVDELGVEVDGAIFDSAYLWLRFSEWFHSEKRQNPVR